ncbi:hypothetical protein Tco_0006040 [Tanacetum coccineum]
MRTRSQSRNSNRQQQQVPPTFVEPFNLVEPIENQAPPVVTMADNRTMAQLLEAPTEGYEDAIVVPEITADNFELKHGLLTLVQNKQFFGHDKEDPHAHIRYFNKITSTMKFPNVPSTSVKLMLFPFSLEGAARIWLEKEPPRSILTWDDLVSKFIVLVFGLWFLKVEEDTYIADDVAFAPNFTKLTTNSGAHIENQFVAACFMTSYVHLLSKSRSPKLLAHPMDFSCWAVFSIHHSFTFAPGDTG